MILKTLDLPGLPHGFTPAGQKQLAPEAREWQHTADLIAPIVGLKQVLA